MRMVVVTKYPPSIEGVSEYAAHVINGLAARSDVEKITVVANQVEGTRHQITPRVEVRPTWRVGDAWLVTRILREILRSRPDAVWYNVSLAMFGGTPPSALGFALPAITRGLGIRSVVTLHEERLDQLTELGVPNNVVRRAGLRLARRMLLLSDVVCVTTDRHRRALEGRSFPERTRVVHLPLCGYEEPALEPPRDPATVLMLTSQAPHKGLPLLIESFRDVQKAVPAAWLVVAGVDHPRFPGYLEGIRRRYATETHVEWLGAVPTGDLRATFGRATVVVVPYGVATGSSASVHQAVCAGRPVVATDLPEFRSMAEEENLWLEFFPRGNHAKLAATLESLLNDPSRRAAIARHNLESARRNSLSATADRYLRLFRGESGSRSAAVESIQPSGVPSR